MNKMNNENRIKGENILDEIYLERSRYLLNIDDLLEDVLERR